MPLKHAIAFLLAVLAASRAAAQVPLRLPFNIGNDVHFETPLRWRLSSVTPLSLELFVASKTARGLRPLVPDRNPKGPDPAAGDASLLAFVEVRRNHDEALRRLEEIAAERSEPVTKLLIGTWPAIERIYRAPFPVVGQEGGQDGHVLTLFSTTAIAAGSLVVRFETTLVPGADPLILDEALAIGRTFRSMVTRALPTSRFELDRLNVAFRELDGERQASARRAGVQREVRRSTPGVAVTTRPGLGELELATTGDGANVVVATNSGYSFSSDFGVNWTAGGGTPCGDQTVCDGDPSLAAAQSGAIYYAWMGGPADKSIGDGVSRSTDNGRTFAFRGMAVNCPGKSSCIYADQEHIAADRFNAGAAGDRVYNVWRNFTPVTLSSIRIVCSSDGGATWGTQRVIGAGDFPRVNVGRDGSVYVAWAAGGNMMLNKYTPCDGSNNLTPQPGFPVTVASFADVVCPVPGLDRCNGRNILSSPTVSGDDLDPDHLYYAYATSTGAGNEDIILRDSIDGGFNFPRSVRMNAGVSGRRFMPWVSTYGGVAVVSWYDRRFATPAQNDRTRFYVGTAKRNGPHLAVLTETDLSGVDDWQCATWPCAVNAAGDSQSCSVQPQFGGRCSMSGVPCSFVPDSCPAGETCRIGRGCPKYGDYNGNAAAAGRSYSAWSSYVPPAGTRAPGPGINIYSSTDRLPSDFFVRDWTTNAGTRDHGAQPSTNPAFWVSGDVWNQGTAAVAPLVNDWIAGDAPSRTGANFVFARVSRRAPAMAAAPPATVTVRFSYADFGCGLPFVELGTETVTFAAGDMTRFTPAHSWTLPASASRHVCLVAEIDGPDGDAAAAGASVIADNNKAQRNLRATVGTIGGSTEMFAMVRNDRPARRRVRLRITASMASFAGRVRVIGGEEREFLGSTLFDVGELDPGEIRWLQFRARDLTEADPVSVDFADDIPGGSGFTIRLVTAALPVVGAHNMRAFADVLARLGENAESNHALRHASRPMDYLRARFEVIETIVSRHLSTAPSDPTGIAEALQSLRTATDNGNAARVAAAHNALTERLDAHLTMRARGR